MQTFLPYPDFARSAACLDYRRLGKQRVEAYQIMRVLLGHTDGWANHPVTKMWRSHTESLAEYGVVICEEWISRGYNDSLLPKFKQIAIPSAAKPWWMGWELFHLSHRSNLLRKNRDHYRAYFPDDPDNLPYIWPARRM